MVVRGFKFCEAPVNAPGFQVYEVAPEAVSRVEVPEQIVAEATEIVGFATTVIVLDVTVDVPMPLLEMSEMV